MDAGGSIQHHRVADSKLTNLEMARTLFVSLNDSTPERRELSGTKHLWEEERFKGLMYLGLGTGSALGLGTGSA
jgi:hypothetical protein